MDQHPIPQDVTGFQFKLIGSMTVKQFGYVATGVISAVILYYLPVRGINTFYAIVFKAILIPLFGSSGAIISFVPIEGRPIDLMVTNFVKAMFSPNQYVYRKEGRKFSFSNISYTKKQQQEQAKTPEQQTKTSEKQKHEDTRGQKLQAYLLSSHNIVKNELDEKEMAFLHKFSAVPAASPIASVSPNGHAPKTTLPNRGVMQKISVNQAEGPIPPRIISAIPESKLPHLPEIEKTGQATNTKTEDLVKKETVLEQELAVAKKEEASGTSGRTPAVAASTHQKVLELEKQVQTIRMQKQQLEQEIQHLKSQLSTKSAPIPAQPRVPPIKSGFDRSQTGPKQDPLHVRNIPQAGTKSAGLPHVSDTPNVVVGIVKDSRGNFLTGILVEIKDGDGNPVRAFKTNTLGQFASATPLAKGVYTIELEDPKKQHSFDIIQITADNQIMMPIEIISHDAREELRKQLFN